MENEKSPGKQTSSVRRSIDQWETTQQSNDVTSPSTSETMQAGLAVITTKTTLLQKSQKAQGPKPTTIRRVSVENTTPPKVYASRTAEATACLIKAKIHLKNSRNLKTEIKEGVEKAVERLCQLVKEVEAELKAGNKVVDNETEDCHPNPPTLKIQDTSQLMAKIEEHSKLLLESNKCVMELKATIEIEKEKSEKVELSSYAKAAATRSGKAPEKRNTLHSVVVASNIETETGEEILERVRKAVDAKDGWIKVERVRKAKNRKVIMGFETIEERDKAKDRIVRKGVGLTVEEVKNKDPMVILKDVLLVNTDEDVLKALRSQNRDVFHGLDGEADRIEIKFRRKTRNPHAGHIVISTSPSVWQRVTKKGYVHIDLQRIRVEDQTPLMQCTRCLGYGHGRKYCHETEDMCSHCGGPHLKAQCADWMAGTQATCRNCQKANMTNVEHNAFSVECPVRRRWDELARSTVAYC